MAFEYTKENINTWGQSGELLFTFSKQNLYFIAAQ